MQSSYSGILPGSTKKCICHCFFDAGWVPFFLVKNEICATNRVWAFFFPTGLSFFHLGSGFCLVGVLLGGVSSFALCALVFMLLFVTQIFCSIKSAVVVTAYIMSIEGVLAVWSMRELLPLVEMGGERPILEIKYRGYHGRGTFWRNQKVGGLLERSKRSEFAWFFDLAFCWWGTKDCFLDRGAEA